MANDEAAPPDVARALQAALADHRAGHSEAARAGYRQVLAQAPGHITAMSHLGVLLVAAGEVAEGRAWLEDAAGRAEAGADTWANLASARRAAGAYAEAIAAAGAALVRQPRHAPALYNRALAARAAGDLATAAADLDTLLVDRGDNPALLYERGRLHLAAEEPAAAAAVLDRARAARPGEPALALQAAAAHNDAGHPESALASLAEAGAGAGQSPNGLYEQARALEAAGNAAGAQQALEAALTRDPGMLSAALALAKLYHQSGEVAAAEGLLRRHLDAPSAQARDDPELQARAWRTLAFVYSDMIAIKAALTCLRRAISLAPELEHPHKTYLLWLHYDPTADRNDLFHAHRAWRDRFCAHLEATSQPPPPAPAAKQPLTVGVLAAKLRRHPQLWLYLRAFEALDPATIRLIVYDFTPEPDDFTDRLHAAAAGWRDISEKDDAQVAAQMRQDGLDILINKAGHAEGRLGVCARKPAPVQVQWGGFNTTALDSMDWFLGDWVELPPGDEPWFTERLYRLPDGYVVYTPPENAPAVGPLPAYANGSVTFGCLNTPAKISAETARLWARVLAAVPASRLVVRNDVGPRTRYVPPLAAFLVAHGIPAERLAVIGRQPHHDVFATYNGIDIALDPWPYSGGLTTIEAMWMGVPTITLPGASFVGRHAASHLTHAGLGDWVVADGQAYVAKARAWAGDWAALAELRAGLRRQVARSPLCDGPRFARNLEAALRDMHARAARSP